jgi:hypothetical protein
MGVCRCRPLPPFPFPPPFFPYPPHLVFVPLVVVTPNLLYLSTCMRELVVRRKTRKSVDGEKRPEKRSRKIEGKRLCRSRATNARPRLSFCLRRGGTGLSCIQIDFDASFIASLLSSRFLQLGTSTRPGRSHHTHQLSQPPTEPSPMSRSSPFSLPHLPTIGSPISLRRTASERLGSTNAES